MAQVHYIAPNQLLEKYENEPHTIQKGDCLEWYVNPNFKCDLSKVALIDFEKGKPILVAVDEKQTRLPRSLKVLQPLWPITWVEKYGLIQRLQKQSKQPNENDKKDKNNKKQHLKNNEILIKNPLFDFHVLGLIFQFLDQRLVPERYWHPHSRFSNHVDECVWFDTKPYLQSFFQNGVKLMDVDFLPMYYMETELVDGSWLLIMQHYYWRFENQWQPAPCCQQTKILHMWNFVKSNNQPFRVRTTDCDAFQQTFDKFFTKPIFRNGKYRKVHVLFFPNIYDMKYKQHCEKKLFDKYHLLVHEKNNDTKLCHDNSIPWKCQHKPIEWLDLANAHKPWLFRPTPFPAYSN